MSTTVMVDKKNYEIKDTLLVKEYARIMDRVQFYSGYAERVKTAKPEDLETIGLDIQKLTSEDWKFAAEVVKRCYGMTQEELDNLHNVDLLYLYSEVINESKQIKKK